MKPTTKDKLFALAVAAGKSTKDGNTSAALQNLNIMASLLDEESIANAKEILDTLNKTEPEIKGVKSYIGGIHAELHIGGDNPPEPPPDAIDITNLPHEQALFCLVTSLGGNLRGLIQEEDEEEAKKLGHNVTWLINMIAKWVTVEDWDKAKKIIDDKAAEDEGPDAFQNFLSA